MRNNIILVVATFIFTLVLVACINFLLPAKFYVSENAIAYMKNNNIVKNVEIDNKKSIDFEPVADDVELSFSIDLLKLKFSQLEQVQSVDVAVLNTKTKKIKIVTFNHNGNGILQTVIAAK